ncbi:uncharacterized protein LOC135382963 [Ornithodoros turicata]|uniref:uncharacterized protein LOC135382963 n=1 Tax=Ornithodoros turicata TaxID=34597 RepID=UPI003139F41A
MEWADGTSNGLDNLRTLSSTDLECSWKRKGGGTGYDRQVPTTEFCHVEPVPEVFSVSEDERLEFTASLLSAAPDSAGTKHSRQDNCTQHPSAQHLQCIVEASKGSTFMERLGGLENEQPDETCLAYYSRHVAVNDQKILQLLHETKTDKMLWLRERRHRITGTTCYPLFTYKKGDWPAKIQATLSSPFRGSADTRYGCLMEEQARAAYIKQEEVDVVTCGLLVCKDNPWLACSSDGIIVTNSVPEKLLEIKCPVKGKAMTAVDLLETCKFLTRNGTSYVLKKRHTYYDQVQLGMGILNLRHCDLVVYSSHVDTFAKIGVPFDEDYTWKMLTRLKLVYFRHILPLLPLQSRALRKAAMFIVICRAFLLINLFVVHERS